MTVTIGSLFSGIGGLELGLELALVSMARALGCGPSTLGSLASYDRELSLWKTSQLSLLGDLEEFSGTFPRSGTMRGGIVFPLRASGAPHQRDRVYLVAWRVGSASADWATPLARDANGSTRGKKRGGLDIARAAGEAVADSDDVRFSGERRGGILDGERPTCGDDAYGRDLPFWPPAPNDVRAWRGVPAFAQPAVCRLANGLPPDVVGRDRGGSRAQALRAFGNAVVPPCAWVAGQVVRRLLSKPGLVGR